MSTVDVVNDQSAGPFVFAVRTMVWTGRHPPDRRAWDAGLPKARPVRAARRLQTRRATRYSHRLATPLAQWCSMPAAAYFTTNREYQSQCTEVQSTFAARTARQVRYLPGRRAARDSWRAFEDKRFAANARLPRHTHTLTLAMPPFVVVLLLRSPPFIIFHHLLSWYCRTYACTIAVLHPLMRCATCYTSTAAHCSTASQPRRR